MGRTLLVKMSEPVGRQLLSRTVEDVAQCLEGGVHRTVSEEIMFGCAD